MRERAWRKKIFAALIVHYVLRGGYGEETLKT